MIWSYFGLSHGKDVHDEARIVLKQKICKEQMNMESKIQFQCAVNVVFYTKKKSEDHDAYPNDCHEVIHFFYLIKPTDVDHKFAWDCKNIPSSRSVHSICFVSHIDVTLLHLKQLACFCLECMDDSVGFCENELHVQPRMLLTLEPHNIT
jgi:hypothetical protein